MQKPELTRPSAFRRWTAILTGLLRELFYKLFVMLTVSAMLFSIFGFFGRQHLVFELTSHFRVQYLALAFVCAGFFYLCQARRWMIAASLCLLVNALLVVPWYLPASLFETPSGAHNFRVLLSNVLWKNKNRAAIIELIRAEKPDLFVLQEADQAWIEAMQPLRDEWPHLLTAREHDGRIACFSRHELQDVKATVTSEAFQGVVTKVKFSDQWISFISIHPTPPVSVAAMQERNQQLAETAVMARRLSPPLVLLGDLNATMWTPYFTDLVNRSGLQVARQGFGILPTWSKLLPPALMLPVDHCLVSPEVKVINCRTGKDVGSDHLPLIVDLMIQ